MASTPATGGEKESLHAFLDLQRDTLVWKTDGLGDEELRRPVTPTGTSLLGMIKHLGAVEQNWFCLTFGREMEPFPFGPYDHEDYLRAAADEPASQILDFYTRGRAAADEVIAALDLDTTGKAYGEGAEVSLRWVLLHMIEETARHAGHADVVRELIDGATGYRPPQYVPPGG
jgi:uncharacterized damage-inducible protein DinB